MPRLSKLEHRFGQAFGEQLVDLGVVQRDAFVGEIGPLGPAGADEVLGQFQDGQRGQAQEVELDQADGFHIVLVELAHRRIAAGLLVQRAEVGDLARRDQHPAGVHADVAHDAFNPRGQFQQGRHLFFGGFACHEFRHLLAHVDHARVRVVGHRCQRVGLARQSRHQLGHAVHMAVAHAQHAAHVAQRGLAGHRAEGGDLAHRVATVLVLDVLDDAVAVGLAEVDVEVGHRHPFRVQETFEEQLVLQRVQVGDEQGIGHQRAGAGAPPRPHRAAVGLGPDDEVRDDQEVAWKAHLDDGRQLELQPLDIARPLLVAPRCIGIERGQTAFQAFVAGLAKVVVGGHASAIDQRRGEVRQLRLAQHQPEVAAPCDLHRVGQCRRQVGKQLGHLGLRLEVLLPREAPDPPRVGQRLAFGDAHARFVRLEVIRLQELHRVRGHHGQPRARRQRHGGLHMLCVAGQSGTLQLDVEPTWEQLRQTVGQGLRPFGVAGQQRRTHRA
jgi:hypothetical protein